jgi:uncharacterized protein (TIGR00369 family)
VSEKKQANSRMCFVCGLENPIGLKVVFYEDETGRVRARFTPREEHQGYPGVLHGGITATLLDEAAGRVVNRLGIWMATAKLEIRYLKPVPTGQPLTVIGEMTRLRGRVMEARAEIRLADDSLAVEATALYIQLPDEQVQTFQDQIREWQVSPDS